MKSEEPQRHLIVQYEGLAITRRRELLKEIPHERVEPLKIAVLIGNDLRQEGVEVSIGFQLAAKLLSLFFLTNLRV